MKSLYSPHAILTKQPVVVAGFIRSVLHTGVLLGIVSLDAPALASISLVTELGLSLFTWASVYPAAKVDAATGALHEDLPEPVFLGGNDAE